MATTNVYLHFNGNAEEAFTFYRSVLGGEFETFQRFSDVPAEVPSPESDSRKIMHAALPISKETVLMGCDVPDSMPPVIPGTNFAISVQTTSEAETERIFQALSAGGKVTMPLEKAFWGAYFGMFTDKFGIQWMVNYDMNQKKQS
jgi:PhnB protein